MRRRALHWLALQLQVPPPGNPQAWLRALLLQPTQTRITPQAMAWDVLLGLWHWIGWGAARMGQGLALLLQAAAWPLRACMAALDRLAQRHDFVTFGLRIEAALAPRLENRKFQWLLLTAIAVLATLVLTTPFSALGQFFFMVLCWGSAMVLRRLPGRFPSLALASLSMVTLGRYVWWRLTSTLDFDSPSEAALGYGLLAAEAYTWLIVLLGFVQTAWPLKREPALLVGTPDTWPTVDVFIPTYNEDLSVVQPTVLAALGLDWPRDKLRIYLLDDGRRPEFRDYAEAVGIHYLDRPDNRHAKAGNLNHALHQTDGELVAIFDCDHIPTRLFLKTCVGWFQREAQCAMLQTPHHFFSPDPFERNLGTFRRVPNEGSLFYGLIQDGNDFWNATFFCGSCALIRRAPLMEIGGIAVETVTEDAHTALKLHRRGYTSAYINQPLAAGLATESLSAHVGQRIRWARGMAQIFRLDNPMFGKGLSLWQRLCYSTAMLHFFFGLPRLVFLTAPMAYLFFEWHIINASATMLALYVIPYITLSTLANAHLQGESRHTAWADVYETVLAAYVMVPTALAMIRPRSGSFNVTAKGGLVAKSYFDWVISTPYSILVLLNLAAFCMGLLRLFVLNVHETGTVAMNLAWTAYSMLILGAAMGVASEARQVRRTQRVQTRLPAVLYLDNGQAVHCECQDYSMSGLGLRTPIATQVQAGERVHVSLWAGAEEHSFSAQVLLSKPGSLGLQFEALTHPQKVHLVQCTFARPDAWLNWKETHDADRPLQGLQEIALLGLGGYWKLLLSVRDHFRDALLQRRAAKAGKA
ncbi:UDP-forming cellulose synthase catalytic subunit [Rhodoferax lacus]|uniref:Cellulose synthase catalytic subunit [UDP-forming] n=1 Tax=Rhodoferax lacus TaxID=2184758 RepID=A0A3E1RFX9_9BURK|nr:UDP-forming cellulose synthase catalytic subunit [Rhodoferax lacus]RFO98254.1 UDP-forming cellulose synthase catalytic subunit [Rhodoferax lacus]